MSVVVVFVFCPSGAAQLEEKEQADIFFVGDENETRKIDESEERKKKKKLNNKHVAANCVFGEKSDFLNF